MKILPKLLIALVIVVAIIAIVLRFIEFRGEPPPVAVSPKEPIKISIIAALPVEPWVTNAAEEYNTEGHFVEGRKVSAEVIPMDGLSALNKWARGEFNPVPTVWLAESRAWVNQANIAALDRTGQDIFLAGGRYRTQPLVLSPLVWGIWKDAYETLVVYLGTKQISWDELHKAAVISRWKDMGGDKDWGEFKLVVAHPKRDPAGLTAMVGAAGEYFDKPSVTVKQLKNPRFQKWLSELFDTVVDFSPFGVENMLLFGRSNGDAGQIVESYLLINMEGLEKRWKQPLEIVYPDPIAWFDFPYAIYMGTETSAEDKQAALDFKDYLLSADQQSSALDFGLRPASAECSSSGGLITKWKGLGVQEIIPSASRMRAASRKGLDALAQWYVGKYEE
jgi:ABC-type molybdate transport system substrate-binding protein